MTIYALKDKMTGLWVPWDGGPLPRADGQVVEVPRFWSNSELRQRFGLVLVQQDPVPEGKAVVSSRIVDRDGSPWLEHTFADATGLPPDSVSSRRFFMQLEIQGLTQQANAWVARQGPLIQIAYQKSGSFNRNDPMMQLGFTALGFTTEQIDQFFLDAGRL